MKRTDIQHWQRCCAAFGWMDQSTEVWHRRLLTAYSEPARHYHTLQHLEECLQLLDTAHCENPEGVEMALWFHDAIYNPRAADNELLSAELADQALTEARVPSHAIKEARRLIMLTKDHQPRGGCDDAKLVDIDLAILGVSEERFNEYERQIRQEYAWVPEFSYRAKRAEILTGFLERESIYRTAPFQQRYEASAQANLTRLIASLHSIF